MLCHGGFALGPLDSTRLHIYSDSRSAVKAFASGRVSPPLTRILRGRIINPHELAWLPAHMGSTISGITNSNELAHDRARGLAFRAGFRGPGLLDHSALSGSRPLDGDAADRRSRDIRATFKEVTSYRLGRRVFPSPPIRISPEDKKSPSDCYKQGSTHVQLVCRYIRTQLLTARTVAVCVHLSM